MSARPYGVHREHATLALTSCAGILCLVCCSAREDPPGGRVEHPTVDSEVFASVTTDDPALPTRAPPPSMKETPGSTAPPPSSPSLPPPFSSLGPPGPILPPEPLSKNVPDRACKNDGQCGDGFCDRGRCAAIWTAYAPYGVRVEELRSNESCDIYITLEGRCRSCVSDAECTKMMGVDAYCTPPDPKRPLGRSCFPRAVVGGGVR